LKPHRKKCFDIQRRDNQAKWDLIHKNGGMWRDAIPREIGFLTLGVDSQTVMIAELANSSSSMPVWKKMIDTHNPGEAITWTEIQKKFQNGHDFIITFILMTAEETGDDYIFEYDGPPLALAMSRSAFLRQ
jgi:hypothetical protein